MKCYKFKLVDPAAVFVDAIHVRVKVNKKRCRRKIGSILCDIRKRVFQALQGNIES